VLVSGGQAQNPTAGQPQDQPAQKNAADLVPQLIATAAEGIADAKEHFRAGVGDKDEVYHWTTRWIDARLLGATDKQSRVAIRINGLKAVEEWEKDVDAQYKVGVVRHTQVIEARYARLEAELALANERAK